MQEFEYKKYLFAFMDIMGFKEIVLKAEKDSKEAMTVIRNLDKLIKNCIKRELDEEKKYEKVDYIIFSDSICIAIPIFEKNEGEEIGSTGYSVDYFTKNYLKIHTLCHIVSNIQLYSLEYGIIFRGAISIGNYFRNENIMFSKALVDAYLAESKEAKYPRVIILNNDENDLLKYARTVYEEFQLPVMEDEDYLFVDYLKNAKIFNRSVFINNLVDEHKKIIEKNIIKFRGENNIIEKYAWLSNYHYISLKDYYPKEKLEINEDCRKICVDSIGTTMLDIYMQVFEN